MTLPIGLQLYTVRDALEKDLLGTCQQIKDIGYTHAEIGPFGGHTTKQVGEAAKQVGLELIASHEGGLMGDDAQSVIQTMRDLGVPYVVQPWIGEDHRTAHGYAIMAKKLQGLSTADVRVLYHNHDFEFEAMDDGQTGWDHIFHGGSAQLGAEMDTCWVAVGKHDPVDEMKKLTGRVPLLHIKDCSDFDAKTLCEVGTGKVDIKAILAAAEDVGAEYFVVEQDNNWLDGDCVKSAKVSYDNLKGML